jgi:hypothetical protein
MRPTRIVRPTELYRTKESEGVLGIGHSKFAEHYILRDESDPFVPGTKVRRLRPMKLGERAIGFFEDEVAALIEGLRAHRDTQLS